MWALGYHQPPAYTLEGWVAEGARSENPQPVARFREEKPAFHGLKEEGPWSYAENPFVGTRQLKGLIVLNVMLANSDLKAGNNMRYSLSEPVEGARDWFVARDLGQTFGRTGLLDGLRDDIDAFDQSGFIEGVKDGVVDFEYNGLNQSLLDRVIGKIEKKIDGVNTCSLPDLRLHVRTIVRDGNSVFIGSQSLRKPELDAPREIGIVVNDARLAKKVESVFEGDWKLSRRDDAKPAEEEGAATESAQPVGAR